MAERLTSNFRLRIRPKCMVGVSKLDLSTTALGNKVSMPVGISPTAMQRMAHPEGEVANAKGTWLFVFKFNRFSLK